MRLPSASLELEEYVFYTSLHSLGCGHSWPIDYLSLYSKIPHGGAGETAGCKHEDLSLYSQHPCRKLSMALFRIPDLGSRYR